MVIFVCGIFGWQWNNAPIAADRIVLSTMLAWQNEKRGPHSWGYASIGKRGVSINKGLGTFTEHRIAKDMAKLNTVLAHTRWKTHGEINIANAHPFRVGSVVGAHNGVIYNHDEITKKYERNFPVDSMHVFAHLADDLDFTELRGYGAIEWVDDRYGQNILFLAKLRDGELAVARIPDRGIVWSSDKEHLKNALDCAGLGYSLLSIKGSEAYKIMGGRCYKTGVKLSLGGSGKTWSYTNMGGGYGNDYTDLVGWPESNYGTYGKKDYATQVYAQKGAPLPTPKLPVRTETYVPAPVNGQKNDRFLEKLNITKADFQKAVEVPFTRIGFRGMGENTKGGFVLDRPQAGKVVSLTPTQAKEAIKYTSNVYRLDQKRLSREAERVAREARKDPDSAETCWRCGAIFVRVLYDTCPHCQADLTWLDVTLDISDSPAPSQDVVQATENTRRIDMEELVYAFEMMRDKK